MERQVQDPLLDLAFGVRSDLGSVPEAITKTHSESILLAADQELAHAHDRLVRARLQIATQLARLNSVPLPLAGAA